MLWSKILLSCCCIIVSHPVAIICIYNIIDKVMQNYSSANHRRLVLELLLIVLAINWICSCIHNNIIIRAAVVIINYIINR